MRQGLCTNLPAHCTRAAARALVDMTAQRCPECGKPLLPAPAGPGPVRRGKGAIWASAAAVAVVVAGVAGWWTFGATGTESSTASAPPAARASAAVVLRIDGSAPAAVIAGAALAEGFLRASGSATVTRKGSVASGLTLTADGAGARDAIDVRGSGAEEAIRQLRNGSADLIVISRPLAPADRADLRLLGEFATPATEMVIALDSVAVVVAPANPLGQISVAQLRDLFAGRVGNWSQVPGSGQNGPIKLYAMADSLPVVDTFRTAVMAGDALAASLVRIDNPDALLRTVATDASAIGLVSLQHAHSAKVLPVTDGRSLAMQPSRLLVATEDYPLTRRLWMYVPQHASVTARRFAEFAQSDAGQAVVEQAGFVGQAVAAHGSDALRTPGLPAEYLKLAQGARRLSVNLRFKGDGSELDAKARRDLARIVESLRTAPAPLMLIGFSDDAGSTAGNVRAATDRASAAARALAAAGLRGAQVHGLGAVAPLADDRSADGRERNRRVEVWLGESVATAPRIAPPPAQASAAAPLPRTAVGNPPPRPAAPAAAPAGVPAAPKAPAPVPEPAGPAFTLKPGK